MARTGLGFTRSVARPRFATSRLFTIPVAAPAGFAPTDITGCKAWWDFSDIASLFEDTARTNVVDVDGDFILGVTDKSGSGKHLSEATNAPLYKTAIINGKSVARFDGSNDVLSNTAMAADATATIFIVAQKRGGITSVSKGLFGIGTGSAALFCDGDLSAGFVWNRNESSFVEALPGFPTSVNVLALRVKSAAAMEIFFNGGFSNRWDPEDSVATATGYYVGSDGSFIYGDFDVGEVIAYDSVLSADDMDTVGDYLADKWGVAWTSVPRPPPVAVTGCKAWYDFSDVTTLYAEDTFVTPITFDTQTIGGAREKSGVGADLKQGTTTREPQYKTGIINGLSVGRFDGAAGASGDYMSAAIGADSTYTVFIVAKKNAAADATNRPLWSLTIACKLMVESAFGTDWMFYDGTSVDNLGGDPTVATILVISVPAADTANVRRGNGSTFTANPPDIDGSATHYFGGGEGGSTYGDYDVGEIIVYDSVLSSIDLDLVGEYLETKWGASWLPAVAAAATFAAPDLSIYTAVS